MNPITPASTPNLPPLTPVICGPTAGGKSDLAVDLALALRDQHNIRAEIITADAFQVYQGLDIGTAKPTIAERRGVPHHLIDIVKPGIRHSVFGIRPEKAILASPNAECPLPNAAPFTLDHWLTLANQTIADLRNNNILPIVVGGTHLYIKALLEGLFDGPEPDHALRAELSAMDPIARRAELERVDPQAALRIHPNDIRRTIRALEVFRQTGKPMSEHQKQWDRGGEPGHAAFGIGHSEEAKNASPPSPNAESRMPNAYLLTTLNWPTDLLNSRINARVKAMMAQGLLDEVRSLITNDQLIPQAAEALGYKQLIPLVRRAIETNTWPPPARELEDAVEKIKIETRRFAKNQRTWLRRLSTTPGAIGIPADTLPRDQWVARILDALVRPG